MNLTTTIIGSGALATATTSATVTEDGKIDKSKRNSIFASILTTTATVIVADSMNAATLRNIHQKYAKAYVESLSDEELQLALQKMDLLERNLECNNVTKHV